MSMPFGKRPLRIIAIRYGALGRCKKSAYLRRPRGFSVGASKLPKNRHSLRVYNLMQPGNTFLVQGGGRPQMTSFQVNGKPVEVHVDPATPLLWVLRDSLGMTGTKFGCGMALCGACTVHLDGKAIRSCVAPVSRVEGKRVTTIEGLSSNLTHPLQRAWIELDVPQCGYCQSGQIMSAAVLLAENPNPTDKDIDEAMGGNICRCGTYSRIRKAIHKAAELANAGRPK
jgi:isoquinoline 1-oxidoreductase alpha subunit